MCREVQRRGRCVGDGAGVETDGGRGRGGGGGSEGQRINLMVILI